MLNRRQCLIAGLACAAARGWATQPAQLPILKPPRLKMGDTIGLVAPSGALSEAGVQSRVKTLEGLGFSVKVGQNVLARWGGYAGTVAERVADLHAMFADRQVHAIWAARGGSGGIGLLPHIDYALVRRNPKILVGYSDITALHLALFRQAGLVSFHGPTAGSTFSDYSLSCLRKVLMEGGEGAVFANAADNTAKGETNPAFVARTLVPGVGEGVLMGGNLSVLVALVGTPFAAPLAGSLLFLEDVGEEPYRVDRMLHQLQQSAPMSVVPGNSGEQALAASALGLGQCAGVMLGIFTRSEPTGPDPSLSMSDVLNQHFLPLAVPSGYGYSVGHIAHQMTLPLGIRSRLDTRAQTLTLLESAVSG